MGSTAFRSEFDGIALFLNHHDAKEIDLVLAFEYPGYTSFPVIRHRRSSQNSPSETVWKIAGGFSSVGFCRQEAADGLSFVPSWTPSGIRFGTRSDFPNSFGRYIL